MMNRDNNNNKHSERRNALIEYLEEKMFYFSKEKLQRRNALI